MSRRAPCAHTSGANWRRCALFVIQLVKPKMWQEVEATVPDITVLRKLLFASVYIPKATPQYLEEVVAFAFNGRIEKPNCDQIRVLLENIQELDEKAFSTNRELTSDLRSHPSVQSGVPLGVILISENDTCKSCGGKLLLRSDCPGSMTIYTDTMGTIPATHYRKYCQNYRKGCTFTQHYSPTIVHLKMMVQLSITTTGLISHTLYQRLKQLFLSHC